MSSNDLHVAFASMLKALEAGEQSSSPSAAFTQRLVEYVSRLRAASNLAISALEVEQAAVASRYRALFSALRSAGDGDLERDLSGVAEAARSVLVEELLLGRAQVRRMLGPALALLEEDADRAEAAVSAYVSRGDCYDLVHGTVGNERAAIELFGPVGAGLHATVVRDVRTQLLAELLAYVHARCFTHDIARWRADEPLRAQYAGDRESYLLACMEAAQAALRCLAERCGATAGATQVEWVACLIQARSPGSGQAMVGDRHAPGWALDLEDERYAHQAHACVVNHRDRIVAVGVASASLEENVGQLVGLTRMVRAAELLVQQEGPLMGYGVHPFYFHGGFFNADPQDTEAGEAPSGARMREAGMVQEAVEALARLPVYCLASERHPSPERGALLLRLTPHVAGCNVPAFGWPVAKSAMEGVPSQICGQAVLADLLLALRAMAHPGFHMGALDQGLEAMVFGLTGAVQNFFQLFPVDNLQQLGEFERRMLGDLRSGLEALAHVMQHKDSSADSHCLLMAAQLAPEVLAEWLAYQSKSAQAKPVSAWSETLSRGLLERAAGST